jgi:hypothetical protein
MGVLSFRKRVVLNTLKGQIEYIGCYAESLLEYARAQFDEHGRGSIIAHLAGGAEIEQGAGLASTGVLHDYKTQWESLQAEWPDFAQAIVEYDPENEFTLVSLAERGDELGRGIDAPVCWRISRDGARFSGKAFTCSSRLVAEYLPAEDQPATQEVR